MIWVWSTCQLKCLRNIKESFHVHMRVKLSANTVNKCESINQEGTSNIHFIQTLLSRDCSQGENIARIANAVPVTLYSGVTIDA